MKTIFDYEPNFSLKPYEVKNIHFQYFLFKNNLLNSLLVKSISKESSEIYLTKAFENSPYIKAHNKSYNSSKTKKFEEITYNNLDIIIKCMPIEPNTVCLYSKEKDTRINSVIDCVSKNCNIISLITENSNFYDNANEYAIKNHGIGLLKSVSKECDIIVILNTNINDFSKKAKYVINLQSDLKVYNCNLLWDFYDEKTKNFETKNVKKAFFIEKTPVFLKLKWKIPKKSWQISKKVYNRIYGYV